MAENEEKDGARLTARALEHAQRVSDALALQLSKDAGTPGQAAVLQALSLYRIADALEQLGAEAADSLMEEVAAKMGGVPPGVMP